MSNILDTMAAEFLAEFDGVTVVAERTHPRLAIGQMNRIEATVPSWAPGQDFDEPPAKSTPITLGVDLTNAKMVLTGARLFEQLRGARGSEIAPGVRAADNFSDVDPDNEDLYVHLQGEFNVALVGAKICVEVEGQMVPHFIYSLDPSTVAGQVAARMCRRAWEVYVKTPFLRVSRRDLLADLETQLKAKGFVRPEGRDLDPNSRRRYIWNLIAPAPKGSVPEQIAARQESGLALTNLNLLAGTSPEEWRNGPEFVDFGYHLRDNLRGAAALVAAGKTLAQATSLSTSLTGIDRSSASNTRPVGNAQRATVVEMNWATPVSDEAVRDHFEAEFGIRPEVVSDKMRAKVAEVANSEPLVFPFDRR